MSDLIDSLSRKLRGYWCPMSQYGGLTLRDQTRFKNNGTLTNMDTSTDWVMSRVRGRSGRVLDFDGSDDSVRCPATSIFGRPQITASTWIYVRSSATTGIIGQWTGPTANFSWVINTSRFASYDVGFFASVSDATFPNCFTPGNALTQNTWHHVAIVYRGTEATNANRVQIFIDGVQQSGLLINQTSSGNFPGSIDARRIPLWIGAQQSAANRTLDGQIAESAIWDRALSPGDIRELHRLGPGWYQPQLPRRIPYSEQQAGFKAYWARRQSQLIGGGV